MAMSLPGYDFARMTLISRGEDSGVAANADVAAAGLGSALADAGTGAVAAAGCAGLVGCEPVSW